MFTIISLFLAGAYMLFMVQFITARGFWNTVLFKVFPQFLALFLIGYGIFLVTRL